MQTFQKCFLQMFAIALLLSPHLLFGQTQMSTHTDRVIQYEISMPRAAEHYYHVALTLNGWDRDTIDLKMPQWMPGYYQIMNYANAVENVTITDKNKTTSVKKINTNTWRLTGGKGAYIRISYDVKADKKFVANSYVDEDHGYIVTAATCFYVDGFLDTPVTVKVIDNKTSSVITTGLESIPNTANEFRAPDFDILYDCPILVGKLEALQPFQVQRVTHNFVGYQLGDFDRMGFMANLKKVVEAATSVIGDIPFPKYTFIAIGPGRGGIEHLNNTTFSFESNGLGTAIGMNKMMNFLAHEYFHHYNVKRIRPFELGPFDYDKGSRTNLLWFSEGISVYYEYLIVRRAGLTDDETLLNNFDKSINAFENNTGRLHQSLMQASYNTWSEGPFGLQGTDAGKSISYYDKGPVFGLLLDFSIRHATMNRKSLDDVMRYLYKHYYQQLKRGFTDAELQEACELTAGVSLSKLFEYVYTTKELDYNTYLGYAGLQVVVGKSPQGIKQLQIKKLPATDDLQSAIFKSWVAEK